MFRVETMFDWQTDWYLHQAVSDPSTARIIASKNSRVDKAARVVNEAMPDVVDYPSLYRHEDAETGISFVHFYGTWDDGERAEIWKFVREHDPTVFPIDKFNRWHITKNLANDQFNVRRDSAFYVMGLRSFDELVEWFRAYYTNG